MNEEDELIDKLLDKASIELTRLPYLKVKEQHWSQREFGISTIPNIITEAKKQYKLLQNNEK